MVYKGCPAVCSDTIMNSFHLAYSCFGVHKSRDILLAACSSKHTGEITAHGWFDQVYLNTFNFSHSKMSDRTDFFFKCLLCIFWKKTWEVFNQYILHLGIAILSRLFYFCFCYKSWRHNLT